MYFNHDEMDYHVLTFTKNINLDRLILIQFLELNKNKKTTTKKNKKQKIKQNNNNKAKQNKTDKQTSK